MEQKIQSSSDVIDLISKIKNPQRKKPVCVVSISLTEAAPGFDLDYLISETEGMADFFVIKTGDLTREFMAAMPEDTQVYGGAARAYPIDFATTKTAGQLRYPIPPTQLKKATAALISDIWGFAHAAGLIAKPAANLKPETVTVKAIYGGATAVLKRANGDLISLRAEAVFPGISLDRVLVEGQQLEGTYDPSNKAFEFEKQNPTVAELVEHYGFETVTLGLIRATDRKTATVAIHPNLTFEVAKKEITGNDRDVISDYLKVGQVYAFRIYRDPQGHTRLRCDDIDDDEPIAPALSLMPGGTPWLEEGLGVVAEDEPVAADEIVVTELELPTEQDFDAAVAAAVEKQLADLAKSSATPIERTKEEKRLQNDNAFLVNQMRGQVLASNAVAQRAKDEADAIAAERNDFAKRLAELQGLHREQGAELSDLKKAKRAAAQRNERDPWQSRGQFETIEEWLREELRRYWLDSYAPADRKQFNIESVKWSFGEHFFDGFDEAHMDETKLRKVLRTIVELVSNRASRPGSTEAHPLSDNFKGQIRRQGAGAMRMYVEENTQGALRLHYWKLDAGGFELDGVEGHDTFTMRG